MRKTEILVNKPVYVGLSILDLSKTVMKESFYDYIKPKYCGNAKLCYMDTYSFIVHLKIEDVCKDIAEDFETRFDTSNFELDRPLPIMTRPSNWINEIRIKYTNHEKIRWIKSKNI